MHYQKDRVALKPPLGWNSWDCYGPAVNEVQLLGNARYMAEHLKAHGWQYVVCDIQWYEPEAGQRHWEYNRFAELCMDGFGRLIRRKTVSLPPQTARALSPSLTRFTHSV